MTGFDETVPPDDPRRDENAVGDGGDGNGMGASVGEQQPKPSADLAQDDDLRAGQWGPSTDESG